MNHTTGKTRSKHNVMYEQIRASLKALGYNPLRPMFIDRWMRYRLIVVAVNHLATVLGRDPYRVYQALLCRAERTVRGTPYTPYKQAKPKQGKLIDCGGEVDFVSAADLHVFCPYCGGDIISGGKVTSDEVKNEISHHMSHHN